MIQIGLALIGVYALVFAGFVVFFHLNGVKLEHSVPISAGWPILVYEYIKDNYIRGREDGSER